MLAGVLVWRTVFVFGSLFSQSFLLILKHNDDFPVCSGSLNGKENVDLFALFDGHAGREAADFAAATLPNLISAKLNDDKKPIETVLTEVRVCKF